MTTKYLRLQDGRQIAYCQSPGKSPGIVFLGGYSSDMDGTKALHLEQFARQLGQAFLRFDYTGHGKSSGQFADGCISEWRQDAEDAISALTEGPQILVGSSMGGWISLRLAQGSLKVRIAGFVGIAAAPDFTIDFECHRLTDTQLQAVREKGFCRTTSDYSEEGLMVTRKLIDDGPNNFVMIRPLELPFPTRLLQGTDDRDVDQSVAVNLLNHIKGEDVRLQLVKGEGHSFSSKLALSIIEQTLEEIIPD